MNNVGRKIIRGRHRDVSRSDHWFAWFPVFTGALGTGKLIWLKTVWRNKCCGVTIYQENNNGLIGD